MADEGAGFDLPIIAAGYVRQAGTVAFQRGCAIINAGTGIWVVTLQAGVGAESFVVNACAITGFSPGVACQMSWTNATTMTLFTFDPHGNTGLAVDCTFSVRRLLPGA